MEISALPPVPHVGFLPKEETKYVDGKCVGFVSSRKPLGDGTFVITLAWMSKTYAAIFQQQA
jgi:hypothetical protein